MHTHSRYSAPRLTARVIDDQSFDVDSTAFRAQLGPAVVAMLVETGDPSTAVLLSDGSVRVSLTGPVLAGIVNLADAMLYSIAIRLGDLTFLTVDDFDLRIEGFDGAPIEGELVQGRADYRGSVSSHWMSAVSLWLHRLTGRLAPAQRSWTEA